jgi:phosphatidylserine decarboxylase
MMVGSTVITAKKGQKVQRTDELGYFKFGMSPFVENANREGGSTIILLFQPGTFVFDDDLVANSSESLETLVCNLCDSAYNSFEWARVLDIIQLLHK